MRELIDKPRRIIGLVFLAIAMVMVVLGQTVLSGRFTAVGYIAYWALCCVFTLLAASIALVDLMRVKTASRDEQQELIEETLAQIEKDKREAKKPGKHGDESV